MIQKFNAPYDANGRRLFFPFWISDEYLVGKDPLFFQKNWLLETRNGVLDPKISEGVIEIARIAEKNKLSFEYLFGIAMNAALEKYNNEIGNFNQENSSEPSDVNFSDSNNSEEQNFNNSEADNEDEDITDEDDFNEDDLEYDEDYDDESDYEEDSEEE